MSSDRTRDLNLVRLEGERKQAIDTARNRLLVTGAVFAAIFLFIGVRLVEVTMIQSGHEPRLAHERASQSIRTGRADITDRNGVLLATSLITASLYADPRIILDAKDAAAKLVAVLPDLGEASVLAKLRQKRRFVWLRRHLTPDQQYAVNRLGLSHTGHCSSA